MVVEWSPIAAIMAQRVTPASRSPRATSSSPHGLAGLARFTSARAQEVRISVASRRIRRGHCRDFVGRLAACVARMRRAPFPVETLETGRRRFVGHDGRIRFKCGCNPADAGCGTHGAEAASLGLARLAVCQPALPECLHLEVQVRCRIDCTRFASTHEIARGPQNCWGQRRSSATDRSFVQVPADQPLQIELLDSSGKTLKRQAGWFWMRARRTTGVRRMPRGSGNGARERSADDSAEVHDPGRHDGHACFFRRTLD